MRAPGRASAADAGVKACIERPDRYIFGAVATMDELPALVDELAEVLAANGWLAAQNTTSP